MSPAWLFIAPVVMLALLLGLESARSVMGHRTRPWFGAPWLALVLTLAVGLGCLQLGRSVSGSLRVSLEALEFTPTADRQIRIGGSRIHDELIVPDAPAGMLVLSRDEDGSVTLRQREPRRGDSTMMATVGDSLLGARPVADGDAFCIGGCGRPNAVRIRYDAASATLVAADGQAGAALSTATSIAKPGDKFEIFPLRAHAPDSVSVQDTSGVFARGGGQLFWLPLDGTVVQERTAPAIGAKLCTAAENCVHETNVSMFALDVLAQPRLGVAERRSFRLEMQPSNQLRLVLDTPNTQSLSHADLALERRRLRQLDIEPTLTLTGAIEPSASRAVSGLSLDVLGGAFADISYDLYFDRTPIQIGAQRLIVQVPNGHTVVLGNDHRAIVRVTDLTGSWPVLNSAQWVILFSCLASLLATMRLRTENTLAFALFALLEFLLVFRVLISIEAVYFDDGRAAAETPAPALVTLIVGPLILSLFSRTTLEAPGRLLAHAVFAALAVLWVTRNVGELTKDLLAVLSVGAIAAALALAGVTLAGRVLRSSWLSRGVGLWSTFDRIIEWRPAKSAVAWTLIAVLLAGVRIFLGRVVGIQERASDGGGANFALSIFYVPFAAWLFAQFFARWDDGARDEAPVQWSLAFFVGLALVYAVAPVVVADWGTAIYALPVLIWAVLQAGTYRDAAAPSRLSAPMPRWRHLLAAPALAAAVVAVAVVGIGLSIDANYARLRDAPIEQSRQALVDLSRTEGAWLRITSWLLPRTTESTATRATDQISETMANVVDHSRLMVGPGYLMSDPPLGLRAFHMNDNVSAVHLFGPFGRLGAAAFVALLFSALVLTVVVLRRMSGDDGLPLRSHFAVLCIGVVVLVSTYMIMANSLGAPLTGRNVYLLSVASGGDFAEAMVLFCLALACIRPEGEGYEH